nr:FAD-linked oxidase C-terminal domain-containing protein [Paenarthrobacter nicotinovorans]
MRRSFPADKFSTIDSNLHRYSVDEGPVQERIKPAVVLWPESIHDVQLAMSIAHAHDAPVVTRGAGTGVSGGAHATQGCIVLCLDKMNKILELNPADEIARVEAGVINADLNAAAAAHGLMYAPDPASYKTSTIGGNIATNAGGLRCAKYGVTRDAVLALDVVLADGSLIHIGHRTVKGVAGYDLTGLFVGSEGTLGVIVGATVRLRYLPVETRTVAAFFPDIRSAAAGVQAIAAKRVQPAILELLDEGTLKQLDEQQGSTLRARGACLLLVQTDGHGASVEEQIIREALTVLGADITRETSTEAEALVELRRHSRGAEVETVIRVGEDVAVPKSRLGEYIEELERIADQREIGLKVVAHAGDGNLHPTFWVPSTSTRLVPQLDAALDESVRVGLALGGTITGEHGIGQYKVRWLPWEQSEDVIDIQRRIKEVLDPKGLLNPGKVLPERAAVASAA